MFLLQSQRFWHAVSGFATLHHLYKFGGTSNPILTLLCQWLSAPAANCRVCVNVELADAVGRPTVRPLMSFFVKWTTECGSIFNTDTMTVGHFTPLLFAAFRVCATPQDGWG